jgi:hypothetical protein
VSLSSGRPAERNGMSRTLVELSGIAGGTFTMCGQSGITA